MPTTNREPLEEARKILEDFAIRTGLRGNKGDINRRYLWTDAFAVQAFFALSHALGDKEYQELGIKLIQVVHDKLGHYHPEDPRQGWISGLPEEEGRKHPTAGGLRIGKKMPERNQKEAFNERLEWERDGQYFHYLSRWFNALLQAKQETVEQDYGRWAAELLEAGGRFIDKSGGRLRMYWKMSTDLSRPLVPSMGAHDPLEGLVCTLSAREASPEKEQGLRPLLQDFHQLCTGHNWATFDALGIGGLLLNTRRVTQLQATTGELPEIIKPAKLYADCLAGLNAYKGLFRPGQTAYQRLAFRECGLSLGIRSLYAAKEKLGSALNLGELEQFIPIADEIENFWQEPENQKASSWSEHLDINAINLACSLLAREQPFAFG